MRIVRFSDASGAIHYGVRQPDAVIYRISGDLLGTHEITDLRAEIAKLLAPVEVRAIFCIGLNYREHAFETGAEIPRFPVLFTKNIGAAQNPGDPILLPTAAGSEQVDYEGELAVVIGRTCKNVAKENALENVLGYTCANDVSARDWQKKFGGGQWCRGKGFDTFMPLGPELVFKDEIPDPNVLEISTSVNGEVLQNSNTSDMIFDVPTLVSFLSQSTTLFPGTVILTGTPPGVGMARIPPRWLREGDIVTVAIEGIGELTNPVARE
jgi:2-keto-4-pentenoate hydratase/2-oxohepta-3-ene-1,7-dioic acid hydratase in catechol pathway